MHNDRVFDLIWLPHWN